MSAITAALESQVEFNDLLTFTFAAGSYTGDLFVSLTGFVRSALAASGCDRTGAGARCSNTHETWRFEIGGSLGGDSFSADSNDTITFPDDSPRVVDANFVLSAKILEAGSYATMQQRDLSVSAQFAGRGAALW